MEKEKLNNKLTNKEIVKHFFIDSYQNHDYDFVLEYFSENYYDHSPAGARSPYDSIAILKIVENMFSDLKVEVLDLFEENGMVGTRVKFTCKHTGICMGVKGNGDLLSFEALENFKVVDGKITESWGYWPDYQILQIISKNK